MLLAPEDTAAAWTEDEFDAFRETLSACYYGPSDDDEDGDGETDDCPTPVTTVVPWPGGDGDYDDDRRRAAADPDNLRVLHLTAAEHDVIDHLIAARVPVRGIGSRCAHTPVALFSALWGKIDGAVALRRSPVLGGTFLIFPGE